MMLWSELEAEEDLTNIRDGYSFALPNNGLMEDRLCLLYGFMPTRRPDLLHERNEWHRHTLAKATMFGVVEEW